MGGISSANAKLNADKGDFVIQGLPETPMLKW